MAINCLTELSATNDELGPVLEGLFLGAAQHIETRLNQAIVAGEIDKNVDTHTLALSLQNLLIGLNVMSKFVRNEDEL